MTIRPRLLPRAALGLLVLLCTTLPAAGDEPTGQDLPEGVVARVLGSDLRQDDFYLTLVQHVQPDLLTSRHGPRAVLDQMAEELLVLVRCRALGLEVTDADLRRKEEELDREIRSRSGGRKRLADIVADQGTSQAEFRLSLMHELRKDRLANQRLGGTLPADEHQRLNQVKLVIAKLLQEARVTYGLPVEEQPEPTALPDGAVALVDGHPITRLQYGRQLALRLPPGEVREYLSRECQIGLMVRRGAQLDDAALADEIERMRERWPIERTIQREAEWEDVSFEDRFRALFKVPIERIGASRFYRGLFGLVRQMRESVTQAEARAEYQDGLAGRFGPHVLVTDIKIQFQQERNPFGTRARSRREALELAHGVVSQVASGVPFERVVGDIRSRQDPTYTALRIRVYDTLADEPIWKQIAGIQDGELTSPFDTLSEFHIVRRERPVAGRTFEELEPLLIDYEARQKARTWLADQLEDPEVVRVRWPLR